MKEITLICKGGVSTGLGHLQRSVSFIEGAREFVKLKVFALVDEGLEVLFRNIEDVVFIHNEAELSKEITSSNTAADCCVLDMLDLEASQQEFIRKKYKNIVSLSPVFSNYEIVDYVFTRFSDHNYPSHIKVFSGLKYTIFNSNCVQISDEVFYKNLAEPHLTVGISMGGVDAPNKTLKILEAVSTLKQDYTFWVLLGEGYSHSYQEIVDAIRKDSNHEIVIAKSNRSMWKILSNCSLAVLAGGLTTFEAIYAGLPTINIFEKEIHQSIISNEIRSRNVSVSLGLLNDSTLGALKQNLEGFHNKRSSLLEMRENTRGLLDKMGAVRTINVILEEII